MRIRDAVMKLLLVQPFYASLASVISLQETKSVPTIQMTLLPSPVLKVNPTWYEGLNDAQAQGVLLHELMHLLFLHPLRRGDRDPLLWAVACDLAVNELLPPAMLGSDAATVGKMEAKIEHKLERGLGAERYYAALSRLLNDSFSLLARENTVTLRLGGESLFASDLLTDEEVPETNAQALKNQVETLMDSAAQNGEFPAELSGQVDPPWQRPEIDWAALFKRFLTGRGRMETRATYKRVSRRYENSPGAKRSIGLDVLIALDESGSISDEQLQSFFAELKTVNRVTNARILVTEFDTKCSEPRPAAQYRHGRERTRNGGTDFRPVFELADSLKMPLVVVFTDGEGAAPERVDQRVLWVLTKGGKQPAPYGHSVMFE